MNPNNEVPRITGLLVLEVRNANPNGDPDQESDPRTRDHDGRGVISPVSIKRKLRDLVDNKIGPVWEVLGKGLDPDEFDILEARRHKRTDINSLLNSDFDAFKKRFWDARVFGNTFLEEKGGDTLRSGVAHFGLGVSISPIRIDRLTLTKLAPAEGAREGGDGPSRGMAPLAYRVVEHGVYTVPFFVNPTAAVKSGCQARDIDLLLKLIPYTYSHTLSLARSGVEIRHAWVVEHRNRLGSCSDFALIDALSPKRKGDPDEPSTCWSDYVDSSGVGELSSRVRGIRDLMQEV